MADKYTKEQRYIMMSSVKSRNNKSTELVFISLLRTNKITGWRRHYPIEGTPDFVFPKEKIAVFIDGCFWHKCPKCYRRPKSNKAYWDQKVEDNQRRDAAKRRSLRKQGWHVVRIWEHELSGNNRSIIKRLQKIFPAHYDSIA